jgi:periplasmic divalent cation tolerance protein
LEQIVGVILPKQVEHLLVLSTCPGSITAKQIAQDLVANKVAACVNIVPGLTSYFRWGNKVESADEFLLLIKTTSAQLPAIEKRIKSLHSHELPEIIAVPIKDGLKEYLRWIEDNT